MQTKEINEIVAKFLKENFNNYSINKAKRTARLTAHDVTYMIGYRISGPYSTGDYYIAFHLSARFSPICDLYDKFFSDDTLPKYDFILEPLDTQCKPIKSIDDLENYLEFILIYIKKANEDLLKLQSPIDFLEASKKDNSYAAVFAMKRIMLCKLYLPKQTDEIHQFNIKVVSKENDNFYLNDYIEKYNIWEDYNVQLHS